MNFIFNDNVRILCLSCNVKKVGKLVRFKQKGQKRSFQCSCPKGKFLENDQRTCAGMYPVLSDLISFGV
jgi:hypothetical protein